MLRSAAMLLLLSMGRLTLDDAIGLYERAKLGEARDAFEAIIADAATPPADLEQARLYLAATSLAQHDRPAARAQLLAVMKDKPASFAIDPVVFPAELLALAYEVRVELDEAKIKAPAPAPAPALVPAPEVSTESAPPRSPFRFVPFALSAATAVIGGVFLGLAADRHGQLNAATGPAITHGMQLASDGAMFQTVGFVAVGIGLALLVTGIVVLLVG